MGIVKAKDLTFEYIRRDEEGNVEGITTAVDHVNMDIQPGEFIAILGHNGSGKSTFAKHINALLFPTEGTILVDGLDTSDEDNVMDVRQRAGMVFAESGQSDYLYVGGGRSWFRTGKYRCTDRRNLGTCCGKLKGSRYVPVPESVAE